jgi:hypothetical protein
VRGAVRQWCTGLVRGLVHGFPVSGTTAGVAANSRIFRSSRR